MGSKAKEEMTNTGFNTAQNQNQSYSIPGGETSAINININNPGVYPGYNQPPVYSYPQHYYNYPTRYYYPPAPPRAPVNTAQPAEKPLASQDLQQEQKTKPEEIQDEKQVKPLDENVIKGLNNALTQGGEQQRMHAVSQVLKLLREDPENRKNNPKLTGLINTALHPNQPSIVKEAATIACQNGLVEGNQTTQQLLNNIAGQNDKYGTSNMAASALSTMPFSGRLSKNTTASESIPGQKLDLIAS